VGCEIAPYDVFRFFRDFDAVIAGFPNYFFRPLTLPSLAVAIKGIFFLIPNSLMAFLTMSPFISRSLLLLNYLP